MISAISRVLYFTLPIEKMRLLVERWCWRSILFFPLLFVLLIYISFICGRWRWFPNFYRICSFPPSLFFFFALLDNILLYKI